MSPAITSATSSSLVAEETRLKNYRDRLQYANEVELRNMEIQHSQDLARLSAHFGTEVDNLREAYEVKISQEAEQMDHKLRQIQSDKEQQLSEEKHQADVELNKIKTAHQDQVREFKKVSQGEIETLHKKFQASSSALHEQAKKSGIKEPRTERGERPYEK
ncbi:MAG: hypothetical protein ABIQ95_03725 [Bdellovibrionia bacterium]